MMYCRTGKVKELSTTTQILQLFDVMYYIFGLVAATGNVSELRLMLHTGKVCKVVCVCVIVFLQSEQWRCQKLFAEVEVEVCKVCETCTERCHAK